MARSNIDRLIINSPYIEPQQYWSYDSSTHLFDLVNGRRPAGYVIASERSKTFDDPGMFVEIPIVNQIRPRVAQWRENGYPGVSGITRRLLAHWQDEEERDYRRFFFCQLEAIETLIWLAEGPAADKVGIEIPSDGGLFNRICSKMATGTGKTIVMALLIAWQVLNKVSYPQDTRFSKNVFIVAPGLTVRNRLQVLLPSEPANYYEEFNIVPAALLDKLRQGKVIIRNWQALNWETEEKLAKKKSVDKRGAKSDEAYVRDILGEMASARNILVINDEAHHAWRVPAESKIKGKKRDEIEEATKWVGGLDRIHRARGIQTCYDFSATPFAPSGKKSSDEALFAWIVSDFGLNDAIESGLVKTPRVVIRDDGVPDVKTYRSQLYHIYEWVKEDLNRPAQEHETLPDLVTNAYYLLGKDWLETYQLWKDSKKPTPPVMISVANRTETAARIKYAFDHERILIPELCNVERTLHIDSKVLNEAEAQAEALFIDIDNDDDYADENSAPKRSKKEMAENLRQTVDTVGQAGKAGQHIQNVISVGMLSEGWDAKTVTHIMGLRAFSSQLLCEQVVGRGLRRTAYEVNPETGLFEAEYVNIFGVPFTFIPHEGGEGTPPPPPNPKTRIEPDEDKAAYEVSWPNVIRIDTVFQPRLVLDMSKVKPLELDTMYVKEIVDLAPIVEGHPDITKISKISLDGLAREYRMQRIIFKTASEIFDQMKNTWQGSREYLLAQVINLVEQFIKSEKLIIQPPLFAQDEMRKRLVLTLNMSKVVQHIWDNIRYQNTEQKVLVFDHERPIRSTSDMRTWYTGKPCTYSSRSHINFCVLDSTWESSEAYTLDNNNERVAAWVKNDHLGFDVSYVYQGAVRKYRPDFIIKLSNGEYLVLETKGRETLQDRSKRQALAEWVDAVNQDGRFGKWHCAVSYHPKDVGGILDLVIG